MKSEFRYALVIFWVAAALPCGRAEEPASKPEPAAKASPASAAERHRAFQSALAGTKLVGRFTIVGKPLGDQANEEYTIHSVTKLPAGDLWLFQARIRYADKDVTLPLPLQVKWAEDTPVITLSELTIPGLGTFSARVVVHDGMYAGTWRHGEVAGHLFGQIQKLKPANGEPAGREKQPEPAGK